jgi:hypothetical protein
VNFSRYGFRTINIVNALPYLPITRKGSTLRISLFGLPLFRYVRIRQPDYRGIKVVLLGILLLTIGIGAQKGYHHHMSIGLFNTEIFLGFAIKDRILP